MGRSTSLVVVSGLAGAGKSAALNSLEDLGYYCVDNLPPAPLLVDYRDSYHYWLVLIIETIYKYRL